MQILEQKKSSLTPEQIKTNVRSLIDRYKAIGGQIDTYFLEQILGRDSLEQILSKLYISSKNNNCSKTSKDNICSKNIDDLGANIKTGKNLPTKKAGKPPGSRNIKEQSGWLDKYEGISGTTWYFCRDEYRRKIKKSKIPNGKKAVVEMMIESGYPASQIEEELLDNSVMF